MRLPGRIILGGVVLVLALELLPPVTKVFATLENIELRLVLMLIPVLPLVMLVEGASALTLRLTGVSMAIMLHVY